MRSVLFCPASNARALEKAAGLDCDAVIVDLEDAVGVENKDAGRDGAKAGFAAGFGGKTAALRINGFGDAEFDADVEAAIAIQPDAVVLPKAESLGDVDDLASKIGVPIWLMIETPKGVLNADALASHSRVAALILGPNDLRMGLGAQEDAERTALQYSMGAVVLAARAHGIYAFDGVYNNFRDEAGLIQEAQQGRIFGFHGKTLIHPAQIGPTNAAFGPSEEDLIQARNLIEVYEAGDGNAVQLDGVLVEELHVRAARDLLAKFGGEI